MVSKIQLYSMGTPKGLKVSIALEEMDLPYNPHTINIAKNNQFTPEFIAINPNSTIPAIVDPDGPDGKPINVFESGVILIYLAKKTAKKFSPDPRLEWETVQCFPFKWLELVLCLVKLMSHCSHFSRFLLQYPVTYTSLSVTTISESIGFC